MRRGRFTKISLAIAMVAVVLAVPTMLYAASFSAAQARTPYFIDEGTAGATKGWQSILVVLNPDITTAMGVVVRYYGTATPGGWACGFTFNSTLLATCGPVTIAPNNNIRFHTNAILPAVAGLYQGHILLTTNVQDHPVMMDGWIYHPGFINGAGHPIIGKDGDPTMRGGFHQEWMVDDNNWEVPPQV